MLRGYVLRAKVQEVVEDWKRQGGTRDDGGGGKAEIGKAGRNCGAVDDWDLIIYFIEEPFDDFVLEGDEAFFLGPPRVGFQVGGIGADDSDIMAGEGFPEEGVGAAGGEGVRGDEEDGGRRGILKCYR